jgi:hypothetical protein
MPLIFEILCKETYPSPASTWERVSESEEKQNFQITSTMEALFVGLRLSVVELQADRLLVRLGSLAEPLPLGLLLKSSVYRWKKSNFTFAVKTTLPLSKPFKQLYRNPEG